MVTLDTTLNALAACTWQHAIGWWLELGPIGIRRATPLPLSPNRLITWGRSTPRLCTKSIGPNAHITCMVYFILAVCVRERKTSDRMWIGWQLFRWTILVILSIKVGYTVF
jgi:hypothetical protein